MKMIDQFRQAAVGTDQIFAESYRVRGSETKSPQPFHFMNRFEQLHERAFVVDLWKFMASVEVHDLAEQSNFLHSLRNQGADFIDNLVDRATALCTARLRDDAEGAMHIAALHDRDERRGLLRGELLSPDG